MNPTIIAAAYILLTAQGTSLPPVNGLAGDVMPTHLQGLGRDCQFDMQPRHVDHDQGRGNHISIRMRPISPRDYYDHRRRHRHRHDHFEDQR